MIRQAFRENPSMLRDLVLAMLVYGALLHGVPAGLLFAYLDADAIERNLNGLLVTGTGVVTKTFVHVLDQLLRSEDAMAAAREAIRHVSGPE